MVYCSFIVPKYILFSGFQTGTTRTENYHIYDSNNREPHITSSCVTNTGILLSNIQLQDAETMIRAVKYVITIHDMLEL